MLVEGATRLAFVELLPKEQHLDRRFHAAGSLLINLGIFLSSECSPRTAVITDCSPESNLAQLWAQRPKELSPIDREPTARRSCSALFWLIEPFFPFQPSGASALGSLGFICPYSHSPVWMVAGYSMSW